MKFSKNRNALFLATLAPLISSQASYVVITEDKISASDTSALIGESINGIVNVVEGDPINLYEPMGRNGNTIEAKQMRKFRYQFIMAFWVRYQANLDKLSQNWEDFKSRVTNYGCFCFNNQNLPGGRGQARDLIDQSCKNLYKCQTCIRMDMEAENILPNNDGDCELTTTYNFNLTKNAINGLPEIECNNLEGTCRRALCECDKRFAFELANSYDTWDSQLW